MKRALLVIDVQNEYFTGKMPVSYPADSLKNVLQAMDVAILTGIIVIIIQHTAIEPDASTFRKGSRESDFHPAVLAKSYNYRLEKNFPGSFTGTELQAILEKAAIDTVVISGYMTQMCCDTTARQAFHLGYRIEFLANQPVPLKLLTRQVRLAPKSCSGQPW